LFGVRRPVPIICLVARTEPFEGQALINVPLNLSPISGTWPESMASSMPAPESAAGAPLSLNIYCTRVDVALHCTI
jgi:hypothetical protein